MGSKLTKTQEKVLQSILDFVERSGYPPTIREIMDLMGYASVNNVQRILNILVEKGYIKRNLRGGARCIEVIQQPSKQYQTEKKIPILGAVSAGLPLFAEQNIEGYLSIDPSVASFDGDFVLKVNGDSMKNANINDKDLIIVKQTNFPQNSDIVVALLDDETTVKRFFFENDMIKLQPENPDYQPLIIHKNDLYFKILGKVEAVIHKVT